MRCIPNGEPLSEIIRHQAALLRLAYPHAVRRAVSSRRRPCAWTTSLDSRYPRFDDARYDTDEGKASRTVRISRSTNCSNCSGRGHGRSIPTSCCSSWSISRASCWFKVMLHELRRPDSSLSRRRPCVEALAVIHRLNALMRDRGGATFGTRHAAAAAFRRSSGDTSAAASGGQSTQFRAIEAVCGLRDEHFLQRAATNTASCRRWCNGPSSAPTLQALFLDMLERRRT